MSILKSYFHLFTRHGRAYAAGIAALLVTNAIYMAIPRVLGSAVDAIGSGADRRRLLGYAVLITALAAAQAVSRVLSRIEILGACRRIENELKGELHRHLVRLAPSFYEVLGTGDLMSRLTNDVTLVRALGGPGVLYFANAVLVYLLGIVFMVSLDWRLTLVVLAPLPLIAWLIRGIVHRVRAYAVASREALSAVNTVVQENLAGAQVVRSFALEGPQQALFESRSVEYVDWSLRESWSRALMIPLVGLAGGLSYAGVLALGGPMVAAGAVSLGDLVAFLSYVAMMMFPTVAFGWILSLMQRGAAALERLDSVLRAPVTIGDGAVAGPAEVVGHIRVQGLRFAYDDALDAYGSLGGRRSGERRRAALIDVSVEAVPGEFVALVGRVGSGKSTLLKALLRLLEVPAGAVSLDGVDVIDLPVDVLRRSIAYVPQDDFLFSDTVAANIAYGRPHAGEAEILAAALAAGLDPERSGLAAGLQTEVGERGLNLSGGQRQRVALARALLLKAPVLVLDNALSNVDTETERAILRGLAEHARGRTVVASSNRITAIQDADRIFVFDGGRIVDSGRHDELARRTGLYAAMFEQQRLSERLERY